RLPPTHVFDDYSEFPPTPPGIFFFQAEDGIRDRNVTGVQTCALPISQPPDSTSHVAHVRTVPANITAGVAHSTEVWTIRSPWLRWITSIPPTDRGKNMIEFDVYLAITALSGLVIVSYVFSILSARTRIPTVLMLLALGVGIRESTTAAGRYVEIPLDFIQFFGVLGLILILLEAGLDLNIHREKLPLIGRATGSAAFVLSLSVALIAVIIQLTFSQGWLLSFVYAAPLA